MLGFMFETLGKTVRGAVDVTTSVATTIVNEVVSIPEALQKGYNSKPFSSDEDEHVTAVKPVEDGIPSFAKKGA